MTTDVAVAPVMPLASSPSAWARAGSATARVLFTGWTKAKLGTAAAAGLGVSNGVISYVSIAAAFRDAGMDNWLSWLSPFATDGIIAVATPVKLHLREVGAPWRARLMVDLLLYGAIVFSVIGNASRAHQVWTGNYLYGVPVPTHDAIWLAIPPLAYAGALQALELIHRYPARPESVPQPVAAAVDVEGDEVPAAEEASDMATTPRLRRETGPRRQKRSRAAASKPAADGRRPTIDRVVAMVRELAVEQSKEANEVSQADINDRLGFSRDLSTYRALYREAKDVIAQSRPHVMEANA